MPPSDLSHLPAPPLPTVPHFAPSLPIETVTPVRISTVVEGILLSVCAMADVRLGRAVNVGVGQYR